MSSNGNGLCTPVRNKTLEALKRSEVSSSPALKIPASPLMKQLGYGSGTSVYLLERSPRGCIQRSPWAIKKISSLRHRLESTKNNEDEINEKIVGEAEVLRKLSHPNIIGFRGLSQKTGVLSMEFGEKTLGALIVEHVEAGNTDPFSSKIIEKVCLDVAKALEYLHEEKKLIHGDVKSSNVLIFGQFESAKLCDFGSTREINAEGEITDYSGSEYWRPMEVLLAQKGNKKYDLTKKVDIYPFGLLIFEMIAHAPPHLPQLDESINSDNDDEFDESLLEEIISDSLGTRPLLPDFDFDLHFNLVLAIFYCCTEEDPSKRPDAKDVVTLLSLPLEAGKN